MTDHISKIQLCDCPSLGEPIVRVIYCRGRHDSLKTWFVDYKWSERTHIGNSEDGTHCADAVPFGSALASVPPPPPKPIDFEHDLAYEADSDPVVWVWRRVELLDDGTYQVGPWLLFDTLTPYTGPGPLIPAGGGGPTTGGPQIEIQSGWVIDANQVWHFFERTYDEDAGTWSATVYTGMPGGAVTTPTAPVTPVAGQADRELQSYSYQVINAGSGYARGDGLELVRLHDTASPTPEIALQQWWVNKTQGTTLAFAAVTLSDIQPRAPVTAPPLQLHSEVVVSITDATPVIASSISGAPANPVGARIVPLEGGFVRFATDAPPDQTSERAYGALFIGKTPHDEAPVDEVSRVQILGGLNPTRLKVTFYVQ